MNKENRWEEIKYPITLEWRKHWSEWEAIRELVQNAMDEVGPSKIEISRDNNDLIISDRGRGLKPEHLLMGVSDKKDESARGRFGEGLKIALFVLKRIGYDVRIESGHLQIRTDTTEIEGRTCLKIMYKKCDQLYFPTKVIIEDYNGPTYEERFRGISSHSDKVVHDVSSGQIIDDGESKLYCKDIFVQELENAKFSYNLNNIKLEESRNIPDEFSLKRNIRGIWGTVERVPIWRKLIRAITSTEEDYYESKVSFDPYWFSDEGKRALKIAWRKEMGSMTVMRTKEKWEKEADWRSAKVIRCRALRKLNEVIPTDQSFVVDEMNEEDIEVDESSLNEKEKDNLDSLRIITEKYCEIRGISKIIVEPFILMSARGKACGSAIRLDRDILSSFQTAVGTLVHEIAHSSYNTDDNTKEHFEAIQKVTGTIIANYPDILNELTKNGVQSY